LNNNLKIVSIGPYPPLRGGISDFNKSLIDQLSQKNDITILNFQKLYPRIFFPGKSQYSTDLKEDSSLKILNPLSFLSWKKAIRKINQSNTDIVIFSYWHPFFAPMYSFIAKRINVKKIYFLMHNAKAHQFFPFQDFLIKNMIKHASHLVVMNRNEMLTIKNFNFEGEIISSFHPIYNINYNADDRNKFKSELDIHSVPTILFFGLIRPYKGLDVLINAINKIKFQIPNVKVQIVGEPYTDMSNYFSLIEKNDLKSFFKIDTNFVNEEKLKKYFLSSDLIVLPYKKSTQSGILSLSMNFNLPSIVSSKGGLKDYVVNKETGFIVNPNQDDVASAILNFFEHELYSQMSSEIENHKKNFSWKKFEKTLKLDE